MDLRAVDCGELVWVRERKGVYNAQEGEGGRKGCVSQLINGAADHVGSPLLLHPLIHSTGRGDWEATYHICGLVR